MFAIASFIGFEATAIYGEEARNPRRTIPIATYAAVIVIGLVYALASWAVVLAFGSDNVSAAAAADPAGLTFAAAAHFLGGPAADVMAIMLVTSLFAALLAFHNAISRYVFALARKGAAPRALSRTHTKHGSPHIGSVAQTISATVVVGVFALVGADPVLELFTWMAGLATVSILVLMVLTSVAIIAFFARTRLDTRLWHTRIAPMLGCVGLVAVTGLVLDNFTTLIGGSELLADILLGVIALFFVAGLVVARVTLQSRAGVERDRELTPRSESDDVRDPCRARGDARGSDRRGRADVVGARNGLPGADRARCDGGVHGRDDDPRPACGDSPARGCRPHRSRRLRHR